MCNKRITPINSGPPKNELVCPTCKESFIEDASNVDDVIVTHGAAVAEGSAPASPHHHGAYGAPPPHRIHQQHPHGFFQQQQSQGVHNPDNIFLNDDSFLDEVLNHVHGSSSQFQAQSSTNTSSSSTSSNNQNNNNNNNNQQSGGPFTSSSYSWSFSTSDPNNPSHFTTYSSNGNNPNSNAQAQQQLNAMLQQMFGFNPNTMNTIGAPQQQQRSSSGASPLPQQQQQGAQAATAATMGSSPLPQQNQQQQQQMPFNPFNIMFQQQFPPNNNNQNQNQQQFRPMNFVDMFDQVFNGMGGMHFMGGQQHGGAFQMGDYVLGENLDHILARLAEQMHG